MSRPSPANGEHRPHNPGAFPTLRVTSRLTDVEVKGAGKIQHNNVTSSIYDVKFYPYLAANEDAIFAAVTASEVFICRPVADPTTPYEILRVFRDPQNEDASLNSVVWSQDLATGDPLVCFAGAGSSQIKILNVTTGEFVRTIGGHGGAVNDLAISPLSPTILASASADYTIKIWNLDPRYEAQPCAAILAGAGHKQPVLAMGFHADGRYLLSGGTDTMVNLWPIPEVPDENAGTDKPTIVHYPLFSSIEVHSDYVDCIRFYGDLILSHASSSNAEEKDNTILLWKIDGFSSADPIPDDPPIPGPSIFTRSAFGKRFQRLLTFDMPYTQPFYMRFALFDQPGYNPILVMGNERSRFSFWDLQKLELGPDGTEGAMPRGYSSGKKKGKGRAKQQQQQLFEDSKSVYSELTSEADGVPDDESWVDPRFDVGDPFKPISPHGTITIPRYDFSTRQIAWSNCGTWCVAVGDHSIMCLFKRWD